MRLWTWALILVGCEGNNGFTFVGPAEENTLFGVDTGLPTGSGPACSQISSQGLCTEFVGDSYTNAEVQSNCPGGTLQTSCPDTNVLGVCGLQVMSIFETQTYYYQGQFYDASTVSAAESQCVLNGGVWN